MEGGRKRKKADFYPTPLEFCKATVSNLIPTDCSPAFICDPGAGDGVWGEALRERFKDAYLIGVELEREDFPIVYNQWHTIDYLNHHGLYGKYDLIIGNPPYSLAEEFIRHSLDLLSDSGYLIFLLRWSFLESQSRGRGLWKEFPPKELNVCVSRISFTGDGKTDDQAYGVYVWQKNFIGKPTFDWFDWKLMG